MRRSRSTSATTRLVACASGSPPLTITSRTSGCDSRYVKAGRSRSSETLPPPSPTMRDRVQKRQYTAQRSVASKRARSG
jgi:hypothetical protein